MRFWLLSLTIQGTLMVENIPHIQWHHSSKHTQYRKIKTQFVTNPVTVPVLLFSRTPRVPPRATCPAQPHFVLCSVTTPHAQRRSGAPCTASPDQQQGQEGPVKGNSQWQHLYLSPVKGQSATEMLQVAGSLAYCRPCNTKEKCQEGTGLLDTLCCCM